MQGTIKIADLLLKAKAKLNELDHSGSTPYVRAKQFRHTTLFKEMLKKNGKIVMDERYIQDDIQELIDAVMEGALLQTNSTKRKKQ